jgi:hypothetical protein
MDDHRTDEKLAEIAAYFEDLGYQVHHQQKDSNQPIVFRLHAIEKGTPVRRVVAFSIAFIDDQPVAQIRSAITTMELGVFVERARGQDVCVDSRGARLTNDAYKCAEWG